MGTVSNQSVTIKINKNENILLNKNTILQISAQKFKFILFFENEYVEMMKSWQENIHIKELNKHVKSCSMCNKYKIY